MVVVVGVDVGGGGRVGGGVGGGSGGSCNSRTRSYHSCLSYGVVVVVQIHFHAK